MEKDPRMYAHGPYRYLTKHGVGPGTLPKDVKLVKWEDLDNYYTAVWTDRFLTTKELQQYDIFPEYIQNPEDVVKFKGWKKTSVFESLDDTDIEKLSKYNLTESEYSNLLSLLELINDDDKSKAFELTDTIFLNKKLVSDDTEKVEESKTINYTRRLLGDV